MSTFMSMYRHSMFKLSPQVLLISANVSGRFTTALLPIDLVKSTKLLPQYNTSFWVPAIHSVNISTSTTRNVGKQEKEPEKKDHVNKELDSFSRYEKVAVAEDTHFQTRHRQLEDKTKTMLAIKSEENSQDYLQPHPIWTYEEVKSVEIKHRDPKGISDRLAYYAVQLMRRTFDLASGYTIGKHLQTLDERSVLHRCIFLETVAGVPGFTAAMVRHLHSLRRMQRDHGWIHTLLEEAENERMHLMTFLQLKKPGPIFRFAVIGTQYIFTAGFFTAYLVSPKFCHRFVGYLEEEAVITYTHILEELDAGRLPMWKHLPAPEVAVAYWQLPPNHTMKDVILAIRADEAHHRDVNHSLASMKLRDKNPFKPGE